MEAPMTFQKVAGLVLSQVIGWLVEFIKMLPNLVVAVIVLAVFWVLSIPVARSSKELMQRFTRNNRIPKLVGTLSRLAVIAVGFLLVLDVLRLEKAVASVLAGVGIIGFALTFASKDIASNFMAGLFLTFTHLFRIGDLIRSKDFYGVIEEIDMRSSTGRNLEGQQVILPNKELLGNPIINYTQGDKSLISLSAAVSYQNNLSSVEEMAILAIKSLGARIVESPIEFFYKDFGSNTVSFTIRFWTDKGLENILQGRSEAIKVIKQTFEEKGIAMVP